MKLRGRVRVLALSLLLGGCESSAVPRAKASPVDAGSPDSGAAVAPPDAGDAAFAKEGVDAGRPGACEAAYGGSWAKDLGDYLPYGVGVHDDGAVVVGLTDVSRRESVVVQLGPQGSELWRRRVEGSVRGVATGPEGRTIATGDRALDAASAEAFVTSFSNNGDVEWTTTFGADGRDWRGMYVAADEAGAWVLGHESWIHDVVLPNPPILVRPFLARLRADGRVAWRQTLGEGQVYGIVPRGIAVGRDGGAVIGVHLSGAGFDVADKRYERGQVVRLLIGFDREGTALWSREVGELQDGAMESLVRGADGRLYVTGFQRRDDLGDVVATGIFAAAMTLDARALWRFHVAEGIQMQGSTLAPLPCGGSTLGAYYSSSERHGLVLVELDAEGTEKRRWRSAHDRARGGVFPLQLAAHGGDGLLVLGTSEGDVGLGPLRWSVAETQGAFVARLADAAWP